MKLISVNNDDKRNIAVCKKLKERHGLTFEIVNHAKLNGADKVKYEIYDAIKLAISKSNNLKEQSVSHISEVAKPIAYTTTEIASALGGIFDISPNPSSDETPKRMNFAD